MALNAYQLLSRVLPGRPFGDGRDGVLTVSASAAQSVANATCNGTYNTTTLTLGAASSFANGQVIKIWQVRGSNAGSWEYNTIISGGGTTTLTLQFPLQTNYSTNGGDNCAQVFRMMLYSSVTLNSSVSWSAPAWNGSIGGGLLFACNGPVTLNGEINADSRGFRGGAQVTWDNPRGAQCGEGYAHAQQYSDWQLLHHFANGNGGGGGGKDDPSTSGSGGGGGGLGTDGTYGRGEGSPGLGGPANSNVQGGVLYLGGGGGGGRNDSNGGAGAGGAGGGLIEIIAKQLILPAGSRHMTSQGAGGGTSGEKAGGGGGSGGPILLMVQEVTLGSNLITAYGGAGGAGYNGGEANWGGPGGYGLISINYSGNITGTTIPTYNQIFDGRLVETAGGILFFT